MNLAGIIAPLLTPLGPDETLDEAALERLINHALAGGRARHFPARLDGRVSVDRGSD